MKTKELVTNIASSKEWRDALIAILPADKIRARKEVHGLRVVLLGIGIPILIVVAFVAVLKLFL